MEAVVKQCLGNMQRRNSGALVAQSVEYKLVFAWAGNGL